MNNNALILVDSTKLRELVAGLDLHDEKTK